MIAGIVEGKSVEQLKQQAESVSERIGEGIVPDSILQEIFGESMSTKRWTWKEFKARFPLRAEFYLKNLRSIKRKDQREVLSDEEQTTVDDNKRIVGILNRLDRYIIEHRSQEGQRTLREQQFTVFEELRDFLEEGGRSGYIRLPTGTGKTVLFIEVLKAMGVKTLVVVPTTILVDQTRKRLEQFAGHLEVGSVYGDQKREGRDVTITTYNSLILSKTSDTSALLDADQYDLVILDETHRALSTRRKNRLGDFQNAIRLGFTATPIFAENKQVSDLLGPEIHGMTIEEAVNEKLLSPFSVIHAMTRTDLAQVSVRSTGDYNEQELERAVNIKQRNASAVQLYQTMFKGRAAVAYCAGVDHAENVAEEFRNNGISASVVSGRQSRKQQATILDAFHRGEMSVLCNANILIEGFDEPKASVCLNLAPTLSLVNAEQRSGRALRIDPDNEQKHAVIVEFIDQGAENSISFAEIANSSALPPDFVPEYLQTPGGDEKRQRPMIDIEGLQVVIELEEVMKMVRTKQERQIKEAPENWKTFREVTLFFKKQGIPVNVWDIRSCAQQIRSEHSEWMGDFQSRRNAKLQEPYCSPEAIAWMKRVVEQFLPPPGWMTKATISQELQKQYPTSVDDYTGWPAALEDIIKKHAEDSHYCRNARSSQGPTRIFYSPRVLEESVSAVQHILEQIAPEGWLTITQIYDTYRIFEGTTRRFAPEYEKTHPGSIREFRNEQLHRLQYFSPELIHALIEELLKKKQEWEKEERRKTQESIQKAGPSRISRPGIPDTATTLEFAPPYGWQTPDRIAKEQFDNPRKIARQAEQYRPNHPDWFLRYHDQEYYHPDLIQKIAHGDDHEPVIIIKKK